MDSIVTWLWNDGNRNYRPRHVNMLASACKKTCGGRYRFICITDEAGDYSDDVEVMPLPEEARAAAKLKTVEGPRFPSSYRRLWAFSESAKCLGDRILNLDVDCMIVDDLAPLFDNDHDFVGWRPNKCWGNETRVGGGTWLLRTGTRTQVWSGFSIDAAIKARKLGWRGSDQAWISYCLSNGCAVWPRSMGIYHKQDGAHNWAQLPANAKIVHFNGFGEYWDMHRLPWVKTYLDEHA